MENSESHKISIDDLLRWVDGTLSGAREDAIRTDLRSDGSRVRALLRNFQALTDRAASEVGEFSAWLAENRELVSGPISEAEQLGVKELRRSLSWTDSQVSKAKGGSEPNERGRG